MKIDVEKINILMARNCLNQKGLAEKSGLSSQLISQYLKNECISLISLGKIANALGVDVTEIIKTEED